MRNLSNQSNKEFNRNRKNFDKSKLNDVVENYDKLNNKFEKEGKMKKFINEFKVFFSMIKDYTSGKYTEVPWYIIAAMGSTLLYVLSPIDLIPDVIFGLGYIDDATVMALCLKFVNIEVNNYKKWKNSGQ